MPIALIFYQPDVRANVSQSLATQTTVISVNELSEQSVAPSTIPVETIGTLDNAEALKVLHGDIDETTNWQLVSPMKVFDSSLKPALEKEKLTGVSSSIHEFMLEQAEVVTRLPVTVEQPASDDNFREPSAIAQAQSRESDPELGVIRLRDSRQDPELGIIRLRNPLQDSELGILRLRLLPPPPPPRPYLFLSTYVSASSSNNVFLLDTPDEGRISDNFIRPGLSLISFPAIGPRTNLLASVETNFLRYQNSTESSYDELRFRLGIRHSFSDRIYSQLNWSSQLLFDEGFDDQFFTNNSLELLLGRRDPLLPGLTLDTFYQAHLSFSNPSQFSNVVQSLGTSLNYRLNSRWDTRLGYQITVSDFTEVSRHETYQRITGQIRYAISPSARITLFGGVGYGRSSREDISFDSSFFGISVDATFRLF